MKQLTMTEMIDKVVLSSKEMTNEDIEVTKELLKTYLPENVKNIWVAGFGNAKVVIIERITVPDAFEICSGFCMLRGIGKIGSLSRCVTEELKESLVLGELSITKEDIRYGTTEFTKEHESVFLICNF